MTVGVTSYTLKLEFDAPALSM